MNWAKMWLKDNMVEMTRKAVLAALAAESIVDPSSEYAQAMLLLCDAHRTAAGVYESYLEELDDVAATT